MNNKTQQNTQKTQTQKHKTKTKKTQRAKLGDLLEHMHTGFESVIKDTRDHLSLHKHMQKIHNKCQKHTLK